MIATPRNTKVNLTNLARSAMAELGPTLKGVGFRAWVAKTHPAFAEEVERRKGTIGAVLKVARESLNGHATPSDGSNGNGDGDTLPARKPRKQTALVVQPTRLPPGSSDTYTLEDIEAIQAAAERLGGIERLARLTRTLALLTVRQS